MTVMTLLRILCGFQPVVIIGSVERSQYPPIIRTIETAEILGVSLVEARRLCKEGKISAFKLGEEKASDEWRVFRDSVFEYQDEVLSPAREGVPVEDRE